ncbi:MAG: RNA methyltransferase [Bacteroidota bacterium]
MSISIRQQLLHYFSDYVTDHKKGLIDEVLAQRTRHITVVLEDIYQPHNASAVVRTCDCFGIQDMHIIENSNDYNVNPRIVHGASKWVDIIKYSESDDNTKSCLSTLKEEGYKIVGTTPKKEAKSIHDLEMDQKVALAFGTELTGLSDTALGMAEEMVHIPMFGFTESLNISVCAAISLNIIRSKLNKSDLDWALTEEEKQVIKLEWFKKIVKNADLMEKEFLRSTEQ